MRIKRSYQERLVLPIDGCQEIRFNTKDGTPVAIGYVRVVIGGRGPYVEFTTDQINKNSLHVPEGQKWRLQSKYSYAFYNEHRTNDKSNVKVYEQRKTVDYADYRIGYWYISPFDLVSDRYPILIDK